MGEEEVAKEAVEEEEEEEEEVARQRRGGHCHYIVRQLVPVAGVSIKLRITTRAVNEPL